MISDGVVRLKMDYKDQRLRRKKYYDHLTNHSKSFRRYFLYILSDPMLNGIAPIVKAKGCFQRSLKVAFLIVSIGGFLFQTFQFLDLYWQYSVVMSVIKLENMTKPAITICDENLLKRTYVCKADPSDCHTYRNKTEFCLLYSAYCDVSKDQVVHKVAKDYDTNKYLSIQATKEGGFKLEENLLNCTWISYQPKDDGNAPFSCGQHHFVRGMNEDKIPIACHSLDSHHGRSDRKFEQFHYDQLVRIALKWEHHETLKFNEPRKYYVSIHHPREMSNPTSDGFFVEEGTHYKVQVTQTDTVRRPPPYSTMCKDYMKDWEANGGDGPTKRQECYQACDIRAQYEYYQCVFREINYPHERPLCEDSAILAKEVYFKIEECHDECRDACILNLKKRKYLLSVCHEMAPRHQTVFMAVPMTTGHLHFKKSVEVFSYIGGYLGMWLGWSLLAILDFIEALVLLCLYPLKRRNKKRQVNSIRVNSFERFL